MTPLELDPQEPDVTHMAVQALNAAHQRAISLGRSLVVVIDETLVRIDPSGITELKRLPPRPKVTVRIKRASS